MRARIEGCGGEIDVKTIERISWMGIAFVGLLVATEVSAARLAFDDVGL
jgi:hypothetical protein